MELVAVFAIIAVAALMYRYMGQAQISHNPTSVSPSAGLVIPLPDAPDAKRITDWICEDTSDKMLSMCFCRRPWHTWADISGLTCDLFSRWEAEKTVQDGTTPGHVRYLRCQGTCTVRGTRCGALVTGCQIGEGFVIVAIGDPNDRKFIPTAISLCDEIIDKMAVKQRDGGK